MKQSTVAILVMVVFLSGCVKEETDQSDAQIPESSAASGWKGIELVDVATGDTFSISDFKGKSVLIESFAVWCPTCRRQQDEMKKLHETVGDSVISISLDTDPNENKEKVLDHMTSHGFDWYFSISPPYLTKALIDEFGTSVVNAPSAPVILVCPDQSSMLLGRGVKTAKELQTEIDSVC